MKFSIIIPSYNSAYFLEETLLSIFDQRNEGVDIELIVVDGMSCDNTPAILEKYGKQIDRLIVESDTGPANAINKGLSVSTGEILAWLNADDIYHSGALTRVANEFSPKGSHSFCFGKCTIIDEHCREIRRKITLFKEMFFPFNARFTYQCINYISQPATFFSREAFEKTGGLREDMVAAWDYEFFLRLWATGKAHVIKGDPLASFRWHQGSISGQNFQIQFKEELVAAAEDAGKFAPQTILHHFVRMGIVGIYSLMSHGRK